MRYSFLKKAIELIVEGFEPRDIESILDTYIEAKEYSDTELLERLVIKNGVLLIQSGYRDKLLFEKILSCIGEDFITDLDYSLFEKEIKFKYDKEDVRPISEKSLGFEEKILAILSESDMISLIKQVGYFQMSLALKVSSGKLNTHVRRVVNSKNIADELSNEITRIGPIRLEDGLDAQELILRLI